MSPENYKLYILKEQVQNVHQPNYVIVYSNRYFHLVKLGSMTDLMTGTEYTEYTRDIIKVKYRFLGEFKNLQEIREEFPEEFI